MKKFGIDVKVDSEMLLGHMVANMTLEELFQFVKHMDLMVGDWDFTKMMNQYFSKEMSKKPKEDKAVGRNDS